MMSFWTSFLWIWIAKRLRCGRQCALLEAQSAHVHPKLAKNRVQKGFLGGSKINTSLQKVFWGSPGLVLAHLWHASGRMLPPLMHIFFHIWNFWLSWLRILMKNWTLTSTQSHLEETSTSSAIFSRHGAEYLPLATKIRSGPEGAQGVLAFAAVCLSALHLSALHLSRFHPAKLFLFFLW